MDKSTVLYKSSLSDIINESSAILRVSSAVFENVSENAVLHMRILPPLLPSGSYSLNRSSSEYNSSSSSISSVAIDIPESAERARIAQSVHRNEQLERIRTIVSTSLFVLSGVLSLVALLLCVSLCVVCRKIKRASVHLRVLQR